MTWDIVIICAVATVVILGWHWIAHIVFTEGAQIRRAKRDAELAALKLSGKDKTRTLDITI